jgi:hypothetical protein
MENTSLVKISAQYARVLATAKLARIKQLRESALREYFKAAITAENEKRLRYNNKWWTKLLNLKAKNMVDETWVRERESKKYNKQDPIWSQFDINDIDNIMINRYRVSQEICESILAVGPNVEELYLSFDDYERIC